MILTDRAVAAAKEALQSAPSGVLGLRVMIKGGGCAGYEYLMGLESNPAQDDLIHDFDSLKVFVDPVSQATLASVTIDYIEGVGGAGFKFDNPLAVSTCGCGSSFSMESALAPAGSEAACTRRS